MILDILINTLGEPRHKPYLNQKKFDFNCPKCAEENGDVDNKFNLGVIISNDKKQFNCWKCGYKGFIGNVIKHYGSKEDYKKYQDFDLSNFIVNDDKNTFKKTYVSLPKEFISFKNVDLTNPLHKEAYDYIINERLINIKIVEYYNIGFAIEGYYKFRIIIPSYNTNHFVTYFITRSYRKDVKPPYLAPTIDNMDDFIFNEYYINWNHPIYIVEGMFDVLTVPINTIPILKNRLKSNDRLIRKIIDNKTPVIVALDTDAKKNVDKMIEFLDLLGHNNVEKIYITTKDFNDTLKYNGKEELNKYIV